MRVALIARNEDEVIDDAFEDGENVQTSYLSLAALAVLV